MAYFIFKLTEEIESYIITLGLKSNRKVVNVEFVAALKQKLNGQSESTLHDENLNDLSSLLLSDSILLVVFKITPWHFMSI